MPTLQPLPSPPSAEGRPQGRAIVTAESPDGRLLSLVGDATRGFAIVSGSHYLPGFRWGGGGLPLAIDALLRLAHLG